MEATTWSSCFLGDVGAPLFVWLAGSRSLGAADPKTWAGDFHMRLVDQEKEQNLNLGHCHVEGSLATHEGSVLFLPRGCHIFLVPDQGPSPLGRFLPGPKPLFSPDWLLGKRRGKRYIMGSPA